MCVPGLNGRRSSTPVSELAMPGVYQTYPAVIRRSCAIWLIRLLIQYIICDLIALFSPKLMANIILKYNIKFC